MSRAESTWGTRVRRPFGAPKRDTRSDMFSSSTLRKGAVNSTEPDPDVESSTRARDFSLSRLTITSKLMCATDTIAISVDDQ